MTDTFIKFFPPFIRINPSITFIILLQISNHLIYMMTRQRITFRICLIINY